MAFIDLEKAYDKVPINVMWWALEKHKVPTKYITLIHRVRLVCTWLLSAESISWAAAVQPSRSEGAQQLFGLRVSSSRPNILIVYLFRESSSGCCTAAKSSRLLHSCVCMQQEAAECSRKQPKMGKPNTLNDFPPHSRSRSQRTEQRTTDLCSQGPIIIKVMHILRTN